MEHLLNCGCFTLPSEEKQPLLLERLNKLSRFHYESCESYKMLVDGMGWTVNADSLAGLPWLAARLFKQKTLKSIPDDEIFKTLSSSGTTSQQVSRIILDRHTAALQSKVLVKILQEFVGKQRLPMLIIDQSNLIKNRSAFSARGAGVQGLSFLGRDHTCLLDENMQLDSKILEDFAERYADQPVLIFGFTFMVWQFFVEPLLEQGKKLPFDNAVLFHSGGWKKLQDRAVDNNTFKKAVREILGDARIHNFYGMVEQVGSIFVECEQGHLHAPVFSDLLIRDPFDWSVLENGQPGVIEVFSALPQSYPGHVLMTEDMGIIHGEDDCSCGRKGRYFSVTGRIPRAEARGCSDTFQGR